MKRCCDDHSSESWKHRMRQFPEGEKFTQSHMEYGLCLAIKNQYDIFFMNSMRRFHLVDAGY
jgi:hypothetical protein